MSLFRHKDSTTHPSENVVPPAPVPVEVTEEVKPAPPTVTSEPASTPERFWAKALQTFAKKALLCFHSRI